MAQLNADGEQGSISGYSRSQSLTTPVIHHNVHLLTKTSMKNI